MTERSDLVGNVLSDLERDVLEIHHRLEKLLGRPDLPPCVEANASHARAATWQIVNDLDLDFTPGDPPRG